MKPPCGHMLVSAEGQWMMPASPPCRKRPKGAPHAHASPACPCGALVGDRSPQETHDWKDPNRTVLTSEYAHTKHASQS